MTVLKFLSRMRISRYFKLIFIFWDLVLINTSIVLSFWLRYDSISRISLKEVQIISLLTNVFWIFILLRKEIYRVIRVEKIEVLLYRMFKHLFIHAALIVFLITVLEFNQISHLRLLIFYGFLFVFLFLSRIIMIVVLKFFRSKGFNFRTVVIVGANARGERINRILSKDLTYGYKVLGYFDNQPDTTVITAPVLGNFDDLSSFLSKERVDEMYVALDTNDEEVIKKCTKLCEHFMVRIRYVPDFQHYTKASRVKVAFYGNGNVPVLMLRSEPLELPTNRMLKYFFEILFSLFLHVFVFSWLFPIIAILIKFDSKGPIFFVQKRSGRDNNSFSCYKFRTMYINREAHNHQAVKGDARITKVGAFLRHTSLDELPQFFNVLIGNMAVVGPRPHMLSHTEMYSDLINNFMVRHYAKPGITGWAQVNGFRGETKLLADMELRVEHDIWYIENWSFLLDLKIIWKTIFNIMKGEDKAY